MVRYNNSIITKNSFIRKNIQIKPYKTKKLKTLDQENEGIQIIQYEQDIKNNNIRRSKKRQCREEIALDNIKRRKRSILPS
jgi:hypothetical protein